MHQAIPPYKQWNKKARSKQGTGYAEREGFEPPDL